VAVSHKLRHVRIGAVRFRRCTSSRPGRHGAGCTKCRLSVAERRLSSARPPGGRPHVRRGGAGLHETKQASPFVGQAGTAGEAAAEIGLARETCTSDVNVINAGPPPRGTATRSRTRSQASKPPLETDRPDPAQARRTLGNSPEAAYRSTDGHPRGSTGRSARSFSAGTACCSTALPSRGRALHTKMLDVLTADFARIPALLGPRTCRRRLSPSRCSPAPGRPPSSSASSNYACLDGARVVLAENEAVRRALRPTCVPGTS